jgi:hypothetical protein
MTTELDNSIKTMTNAELTAAFLNARRTYYYKQTFSHALRMEKYKIELGERGLDIPTGEGVLNGPGSY